MIHNEETTIFCYISDKLTEKNKYLLEEYCNRCRTKQFESM